MKVRWFRKNGQSMVANDVKGVAEALEVDGWSQTAPKGWKEPPAIVDAATLQGALDEVERLKVHIVDLDRKNSVLLETVPMASQDLMDKITKLMKAAEEQNAINADLLKRLAPSKLKKGR